MFRGLHHFNLIVSDKEKTKAFYNGLLGLEIAVSVCRERGCSQLFSNCQITTG